MGTRRQVVTVMLPWRNRAAYEAFCDTSFENARQHVLYAEWEQRARSAVTACLSEGQAVELVSVHQDDFCRWLSSHHVEDTPANRIRFIEEHARPISP